MRTFLFLLVIVLASPHVTFANRDLLDLDVSVRLGRADTAPPAPIPPLVTPAPESTPAIETSSGAPSSMYMPHAKLGADWKPLQPPESERPMIAAPRANGKKGFISFNLDEGWESAYHLALPLFDRAHIRTTVFPLTTYFDYADFVTSDQLKDIATRGHEVGNFTRTHADLNDHSDKRIREEIEGARLDLLQLGLGTQSFATAYGDPKSSVIDTLKITRYFSARGTRDGYIDHTSDPYALPSFDISGMSFDHVRAIIDTAVANGRWVILVIHQVDEDTPWSISSETLAEIVAYVEENNIQTVTNAEGSVLMSNL